MEFFATVGRIEVAEVLERSAAYLTPKPDKWRMGVLLQ
jgi:hypothetical protein